MKVPVKRFVQLGVVALLTLVVVGCDSLPGFEGDVDKRCPGEVRALASPSDQSVYLGEEITIVPLASNTLFTHSLDQPLRYAAKSQASGIVDIEVSGTDTLMVEILPLQAGETQVDIKATDVCGQSQTVSFKVEVADICALVANQQYDVYFPVTVGNTWMYSYRSSLRGNHPYSLTTGTLKWELISATACENGSQSFSIQETFDGVATLPADNPDYREEYSWTQTLEGEIKGRALHLGRYTENLPVHWAYPPSTPDTVETWVSEGHVSHGQEAWAITLQRNTGVKQWNTSSSGPHQDFSGTRIVLDQ